MERVADVKESGDHLSAADDIKDPVCLREPRDCGLNGLHTELGYPKNDGLYGERCNEMSREQMRGDAKDSSGEFRTDSQDVDLEQHCEPCSDDGVNDDESANHKRAPDGGWGWMVVIGCSMMHLFLGGLSRSYGLVYIELQEKFHSSSAITAWIGGACNAFRMGFSPLATSLSVRFGARIVVMTGGMLLGFGCILSAFTPNTEFMFLSYSIITGIGGTLVHTPSLVLVGQYFDKRRSIAMGFSSAGAGVGVFCFPPLMALLFDEYGYQGTFIILGGIMFNVIICGALHRPLNVTTYARPRAVTKNNDNRKLTASKGTDKSFPKDPEFSDETNEQKQVLSDSENNKTHKESAAVVTPQTISCCKWRCSRSFQKYLDLSLLREPSFLAFVGAMFFFTMSYMSGQLLLPDWGLSQGYSRSRAVFLLSILGVADFFGRVGCGFVFNLSFIKKRRPAAYNFSMLMAAGTHFLWAFSNSYEMLAGVSVIHGLCNGVAVSQRAVILSDLLGVERLSTSLGLTAFTQGLGIMIGPALAGYLRDRTNSYVLSYIFSGSVCVLAVIVFMTISRPRACRCRGR